MPPLALQIRLEEHQVVAIDAARTITNHTKGMTAHLSRQQVISAIIDQWIEWTTAQQAPAPARDAEAVRAQMAKRREATQAKQAATKRPSQSAGAPRVDEP
jgi:hypothetical protein